MLLGREPARLLRPGLDRANPDGLILLGWAVGGRRRVFWETPRGAQLNEAQQLEGVAAAADAPPARKPHFLSGLRGRLLLLTTAFVLFATLLIYPVLAGTYRNNWLEQRAQAAQIAALAVTAAPDGRVSDELSL